jgi:osmotically inducible protein OsmC
MATTERRTMATERRAQVTWQGDLMSGSGTIETVGSGAFGPLEVTWTSRAEKPEGRTSPEELIAAAHAACFSMALSHGLAQQGHAPESLSSTATVTFVPGTGITKSVLDVEGNVPGVDDGAFREAAEDAKENCPVSQALKGNVELELNARLLTGAS